MTNNIGTSGNLQPNRTYKARIFEMVFSDKKDLLELYNAVNGTHYDNPEDLVVNTLENAVYMSMHNDVSFIIDLRLNLYEHQSTYNPNLPLRFFMYAADIYSDLTKDENLYGTKAIQIPPPKFVIFYNGEAEQPDRKILRLSDLYTVPDTCPSLELTALMLNINKGRNEAIMEACKTLKDYAEYTFRVRTYAKELPIESAVERAITECIREGILSDFLSRNRAEAKKVSIYEYDEEKHMRQTREEGKEEGIQQTKLEAIKKMMKALNITAEHAMEILEIPENEQEEYLSQSLLVCTDSAKAKKVNIYEYDKEKHMRQTREEGKQEGRQQTRLEDIGKMMKALNITAEHAMEILEIPENEQEEYLSKLPK